MQPITDRQFKLIANIARERWGLHLPESKIGMVRSRLGAFLSRSPHPGIDAYLEHLTSAADEEDRLVFFDLLSTNVTRFFRDRHHLDYLERELYTPLARGAIALPGRRVRVWSAGCATGCEPYSIAIHARESLPQIDGWDFRILATDLSNTAVATARAGVYPEPQIADIDPALRRRHFQRGTGPNLGLVRVAPAVRSMVSVARLNLVGPWPMRGPLDAIFCRNVMIYLDPATREGLIERFCGLLRPGGLLFIGGSETLSGIRTPLRPVAPSTYAR